MEAEGGLSRESRCPSDQTVRSHRLPSRKHFDRVNATLRGLEEKSMPKAEPKHVDALLKFAARAYRQSA